MADPRYHVLARKWRPATFSEVVGQEHVTKSLANAIRQGRIHHAYLFCGPRGVGKTTVARILAKALNCVDGPTDAPCLKCPSCLAIAAGTSMDVLEIDGASNNSVEQVRDLRETVGYAAAEGRFRVIIIDEVHMLSKAAFNALLKTLEEPPSHVVFIFATTEANKVIPTVQSRCQRYDFHRLSVAEIRAQIARICEAESLTIEPAGLDLIAQKADGALRDAESLLDQVAAATEGPVAAPQVADLIGAVERAVYVDLVDAIAAHDVPAVLAAVAATIERGRSLAEFVAGLMAHLRHLLACRVSAEAALVDLEEPDRKRLAEQAAHFAERDLLRMLNAAAEAETNLASSAAPQVRVELALLKMAYMEGSVDLADLMARLEEFTGDAERRPPQPRARGPAPSEDESAEREGPQAEPPEGASAETSHPRAAGSRVSAAVLEARWPEMAAALRAEAGAPPWIESQVDIQRVDDETLRLVAKEQFYVSRLRKMEEQILGVIRQRFPDVRRLDIVASGPGERQPQAETTHRGDALVQGIVQDEPIVGKLIDALGLDLIE